jgi:hypothetical protein
VFLHYSTLGLLALTGGVAVAVPGVARDLALALLAAGSIWLATRAGGLVFSVHSAGYVLAASVTSGLASCLLQIWLTSEGSLPSFPWTGWIVLIAALLGGRLPRAASSRPHERMLSMSRLALAIVVTTSVGGGLVLLLAPAVGGAVPDPGRLAALKTVILSCAAVALAIVRRHPRGAELGWLASPVLIAGGVKLFVEDLRVSSPATLFIGLATFGTALILTSRLARTRTHAS